MSAQIPTPSALAQRFAAALEAQSFTASDGSVVRLDATAPATFENALAILSSLSDYEVYLFLRDQLLELMVTTATEGGLLPQHAKMWGVPRIGATSAVGNFIVSAAGGVSASLPAGSLITVDGSAQWTVVAAVTIPEGASAAVAVRATEPGIIGNLAANTAATFVSPIPGVSAVVSDQSGLAGGAPIEDVETWRARIIAAIRAPIGGGTKADYQRWATQAGAAYFNVVAQWLGAGTVGIIVAMSGPSVPTQAQLQAMQAYIDGVRPIRGNAYVVPAQVVSRDVTIKLDPDTVSARQQIAKQLTAYFPSKGIGGALLKEEIERIITTLNGDGNTLIAPAASETLTNNQIAILGAVNWQTT